MLFVLGVVPNYQHFHKRTNRTLGEGVNSNVHFLDILNVDRTFHYETQEMHTFCTLVKMLIIVNGPINRFLILKVAFYRLETDLL